MQEFNLNHWALDWFIEMGITAPTAQWLTLAIDLIIVLLLSGIADWISRKVLLRFVRQYVTRSKNKYDDVFLEKKVFGALAHLVPAAIVWYSLPWLFEGVEFGISWLRKIVTIYMIIVVLGVVRRFMRAVESIAMQSRRYEGKPVASYIQVFMIVSYIIGAVLILSMVIGKSPIAILTAFGAATAILLLIFRDTILGLVASIQISANDMVRLGDWVSMDKYGADGDVIEINLTTVKVRNWDKTITTVPTYAFIADSFKNWRGMQSMGVRRIKRSINVNINSVGFVEQAQMEVFMKLERVAGYVKKRQEEIDQYNREKGVDKTELINGRQMTNLGVFRHYALQYLREHPKIAQNETVMVRQLQPTETGVPLEIYCFSSDIAWVNYEGIQSDIFDHLLAAAPRFGLQIFQNPSGADLRSLNRQ